MTLRAAVVALLLPLSIAAAQSLPSLPQPAQWVRAKDMTSQLEGSLVAAATKTKMRRRFATLELEFNRRWQGVTEALDRMAATTGKNDRLLEDLDRRFDEHNARQSTVDGNNPSEAVPYNREKNRLEAERIRYTEAVAVARERHVADINAAAEVVDAWLATSTLSSYSLEAATLLAGGPSLAGADAKKPRPPRARVTPR